MSTLTLRLGGSVCSSSLEAQGKPFVGRDRDVYSSSTVQNCALLGSSKSELRGALLCSTITLPQQHRSPLAQKAGVIQAAWTRRSKGALDPPKGRKSWTQRHEKFLKPFILDVFFSHKYIHAKVVHRVTSKVISVATTNAKDLRFSLYSLTDENACKLIGKLLAERSIEADVFAVTFNLRKGERFEGKLALVVNTLVEHGVALV
ncbi:unnamed protein product [Calypogeia fissa]